MPDEVAAGSRVRVGDVNNRAPLLVAYEPITATTPTTTSSSPAAAITTDPITFKDGRAYRLAYRGGLTTSVATGQGTMTITKGTAAGAVLLNGQRLLPGLVGTVGFYYENIIGNNSGADITAVLVGTYALVAGTGTAAVFGSATTPAYLEIQDIGPAADYINATALT